jgi:hypothetical protein
MFLYFRWGWRLGDHPGNIQMFKLGVMAWLRTCGTAEQLQLSGQLPSHGVFNYTIRLVLKVYH